MAGIYIHIPFCKRKCTYCDFYTEVAPTFIPLLVNSIVKELHLRKNYLKNEVVNTIYFGGGTPSILNLAQFSLIFDAIYELFPVNEDAEITFEANPDDLTVEYLESLKDLPFNRLSIGIQSFDDEDLKRINRRHTGAQAVDAVRNAQRAGFGNISIDLIYGLPFQTIEGWAKQLEMALSLGVQHISSYGLTYEEGTALWIQRDKGKVVQTDDDTMNEMYLLLVDKVQQAGFEAYEVSNFALSGFRSQHNTSYWKQEPYLGVGPSAHSYDLISRQWNVSSIKEYINALDADTEFSEREELTLYDRYNDFVMVSLRTSDGLDKVILKKEFGTELYDYCLQQIQSFIDSGKVIDRAEKFCLSADGVMISNLILIQLMKV